ncbi:RNA-binding protein 39-like isoform X2 [Amphibalanus amphitrite]|uniref:RNA-binding protein 39-like isoform X2 n=1 Tax=Amphibalanus amphitrite TaxID=1232801 RepID=UPI001C8FC004|nr:RNA-binding protein 39-like isoform X2 [Amphibalanus amphitrite]XP_043198029.1 RNA-binding protein 39-like isoform X2 [Amphibalanus amphitrite]XP_043198031.1 RNA-binding protein 39-like isoform X2 [Amphibalanus amphitrite]XP_043209257.1 RNA-binding protein 39-like isoform X2 [Amphibalanus amphitrite]XP_043209258.1 RNA-binding protein 39-like isoform X2 [Amphibalanus amphitrite]XP_043209259.1 RNA-binding protein 39-like isoform X2 [Amphibalanus amphitrite]XP_043209260.1 RNA-binding protein 
MADDLDVHELLEAPYTKKDSVDKGYENGTKSSEKSKSSSSRHRSRSRSKSRDRRRRSKDRDREKDRDSRRRRSRSRSRSRDRSRRHRSRSRDRRRSRSRSRDRGGRGYGRWRGRSPRHGASGRSKRMDMTPEERDARTVLCMQVSQRLKTKDVEEFFSSVGKVTDVRMIMCNKTRRFKGIVYVEFKDVESVPLALGLTGQKLLGIPIMVQPSQAEKNRAAAAAAQAGNTARPNASGSMRLYVGSLHFNITEEMLKGIFEPFGKIDDIQLIMDSQTGRSRGYGFLTFHNAEDAKRALEKLNGFELAGRPMKVGHVTERSEVAAGGPNLLDSDEMDRSGVDLGATGRLQLMAKLAEGTGMQIPTAAANALNSNQMGGISAQSNIAPPIATQCFMLSNMFDTAAVAQNPNFDAEIRDDVVEECNKHGGVTHVYVDKQSPQGNVYVKCPSIASAAASVNSLHGRWFAGKVITAAYVPLINYHSLFPDAMAAQTLLLPLRAQRL